MVSMKNSTCVVRSLLYRLHASASGCTQLTMAAANLWHLLRPNRDGMTRLKLSRCALGNWAGYYCRCWCPCQLHPPTDVVHSDAAHLQTQCNTPGWSSACCAT
jgi:hypothetical protein